MCAVDAKDTCALCCSAVFLDATRPFLITHALHAALQRAVPMQLAAHAAEAQYDDASANCRLCWSRCYCHAGMCEG